MWTCDASGDWCQRRTFEGVSSVWAQEIVVVVVEYMVVIVQEGVERYIEFIVAVHVPEL